MKKNIKNLLLKKDENSCAMCGIKTNYLDIHHIIPKSIGGTDEEDNLILLCNNCNRRSSIISFTEVEFNNYLSILLDKSNEFKNVIKEEKLSKEKPFRADITVQGKDETKWLIECKNTHSFTASRFDQAISQINRYKEITNFDYYVLAFPGLLSDNQKNKLKAQNIIAWDAEKIGKLFKIEISKTSHPIFQTMFASIISKSSNSPEEDLIDKLKKCEKGKLSWSEFQKLTGQILEYLFCPPLETPISESADINNINRRDWIIPNYADSGFWHFIREKYHADYIVVDAKNYKAPISKGQILQIANYLKEHGAGLFAIIVTRLGANNGAQITMREQWMGNQKMIVILDDTHLEAMLLAKMTGGEPTKIIGQVIEQFRLSM